MSETGYIFRGLGDGAVVGRCRLATAPSWFAGAASGYRHAPTPAAKAADGFARSPR